MFVAAALVEGFEPGGAEKQGIYFRSGDPLPVFLVIWLVVPIAFFSFSSSKLPGYILPALPAGTLLLAEYVRRHVVSDERKIARPPSSDRLAFPGRGAAGGCGLDDAIHRPAAHVAVGTRGGDLSRICRRARGRYRDHIARPVRLRVLRFVSLVPVVLAVAAVLRLGAPALDATLSARPLAQEINRVDNRSLPLAILRLPRETEYGLQFYRNQSIPRYELGQIPEGEHLLVAREGWQKNIAKWTTGRRVTYLGSFAAQGLDYYWVAGKE